MLKAGKPTFRSNICGTECVTRSATGMAGCTEMDSEVSKLGLTSRDFRSLIASDYARVYPNRQWAKREYLKSLPFHPGLVAMLLLRMQNNCLYKGHRRLAGLIRSINFFVTGADFVVGCQIGSGLQLTHPSGVVVGYAAVIGNSCTLMQQATLGQKEASNTVGSGNPLLADNVVISAGAKVLGNVRIGRNSVVGANSVVLIDVPDGAIAVGIPAVVKMR